jgi:hypothetical protein
MFYLPRKEADLIDWMEGFTTQIAANAAVWEITQGEVLKLQNAFGDFKQKYSEIQSAIVNLTGRRNWGVVRPPGYSVPRHLPGGTTCLVGQSNRSHKPKRPLPLTTEGSDMKSLKARFFLIFTGLWGLVSPGIT